MNRRTMCPRFPTPSLYTKNAVAFFAPVSPVGLAPAESVPEDVAAHCFRSTCVPLRALRLVRESGVDDRADDAASSRAGSRRNVGPNYARPATGQRRITACVMRPFGRGLFHTLPFPRTPASVSAQKKRFRLSPYFLIYGGPYGLEQQAFCSLVAALGESRRGRWCERRRKTLRGTQGRRPGFFALWFEAGAGECFLRSWRRKNGLQTMELVGDWGRYWCASHGRQ